MRTRGTSALVGALGGVMLSGCYQGEWRRGVEVPIATTGRLLTVRTVETWELAEPGNGYVLRLRSTSTPRCRHALYGRTSRTDTGTFERLGGNWWKGAAVLTGIAGGAGLGIGLGGWIAGMDPKYGPPVTYAAGGAIAAGGLASCLASISSGSKVRYTFCGILTGFGASLLAGGALSTLPGGTSTTTTSTTSSSGLIDQSTFQTITMAGGGVIGASILTGIIGNAWQGNEDRIRTVDSSSAAIWDDQEPEADCNVPVSLVSRRAILRVIVENVATGAGSEETPLVVKVPLLGPGPQMVDLRRIRHELSHCGALTVKVVPDVAYPAFRDEYTPLVSPDQLSQAVRPIFSQVLPPEGVVLEPLAVGTPPLPAPRSALDGLHGIEQAKLKQLDRRCSGEVPSPVKTKPPVVVVPPEPSVVGSEGPAKQEPPQPSEMVINPGQTRKRQPQSIEELGLTPGLQLQAPLEGHENDSDCSRESQKARLIDCEHQCGRNLQVASCVTEFRACVATARSTAQPLRERSVCEGSWHDCVNRANVSSSSFKSCTEACADANTPAMCREAKPPRLMP